MRPPTHSELDHLLDSFDLRYPLKRHHGSKGLRPVSRLPQAGTDEKRPVSLFRYGKMFHDLPEAKLDHDSLIALGSREGRMEERGGEDGDARQRPAGTTFFGQFLTHEITFDPTSSFEQVNDPDSIWNFRSPFLELDSVYGLGPEICPYLYDKNDPDKFIIGLTEEGKSNDLPRNNDGVALIGDPRNDENLILSQLHLAFLKFHNRVVEHVAKLSYGNGVNVFQRAQDVVRKHFQWIVLHEFLPYVVDKEILDDIVQNGPAFYKPQEDAPFIPVEFSVAVFRFGHSMIRADYQLNDKVIANIFPDLLGGQKLKDDRIIEWERFFWIDPSLPPQRGRKIDTLLASPLFKLPFITDEHEEFKSLAVRDFVRGTATGLPSGESVARHMGHKPLTREELGIEDIGLAETPLWYYILKESKVQNDGERLGLVGGRIVAEVLVGLLRADAASILRSTDDVGNTWKPFLPSASKGHFTMADLLTFSGLTRSSRNPAQNMGEIGRWEVLPYDSQIEAVHMSLLPTGKVIYYSGFRIAEAERTETRLWDPRTGEIKAPHTPADLFCAGHCLMNDGRLLSSGGTLEYRGVPPIPAWLARLMRPLQWFIGKTLGRFFKVEVVPTGPTFLYIFDPWREQWEFAGDMIGGRWYPTNTLLPNGTTLILSGYDEGGGIKQTKPPVINRRMEVFGVDGKLRLVGTIPVFDEKNEHEAHGHRHELTGEHAPASGQAFPSDYPRMFVLPLSSEGRKRYPAGRAFCAGYAPATKMLDLRTWEWEDVDSLRFGVRHDGCAVLLPLRPPDYRARVFTFGGSVVGGLAAKATNSAELIDFGEPVPRWKAIESPKGARVNGAAVVLPDGNVLALSGNTAGRWDDPVLECEVYNPDTGKWTQVAPMSVARGYHATAILLPDGKVLSAGTTPLGELVLELEVYSPYYLFKGARPVIDSVNDTLEYDKPFEVNYTHTGRITRMALISPGSMTHSFDMHQRYIELQFSEAGTGMLKAVAPPDEHVAPPGHYMLFLISEDGVPSVAKFVRLPLHMRSKNESP